jgi:hypothetical protein
MSVRWASAKTICSAEGFSAYPKSLHILFAVNDPKKKQILKRWAYARSL